MQERLGIASAALRRSPVALDLETEGRERERAIISRLHGVDGTATAGRTDAFFRDRAPGSNVARGANVTEMDLNDDPKIVGA